MIYIHGIGHFHPENMIDNKFFENLDIDTNNDWIMERVGISKRRTVLPLDYIRHTKNLNPLAAQEASLYTNAQTGAKAATHALKRAGLKKEDIGMVISGSCTPQHSCPAEACTIAAELGIEAISFDINSACSSVAAQINFINMMQPELLPDYILIVNPENNTRQIDYSDRSSSILWGDCSSALIVSTKILAPLRVRESYLESSPKGWDKVRFPLGKHFQQDGRTVQTFAIKRCLAMIKKMRNQLKVSQSLNMKFIGHQANLRMLESVCRIGEIKTENHFSNVENFGNCGAAGAPSVLSQYWDEIKDGDFLTLSVVGAGLSWGGILLEKVGENK